MSTPLKVREIEASKHKSTQFATLSFYFLGEDQVKQRVYTSIKCELHLVNGFQANILVGNNILSRKGSVININKNCALIGSYKVTISINARQRWQFLRRKLFATNNNVVLPHLKMMIPLSPVFLPDNRDFLFHPTTQVNLTLYAQIVDNITTKMLVSNISDSLLRIS